MDIGLANEKAGQELSSYSGTFQPAPGNKTVTYLGKFAFDSPSNWCQDNIISLMSRDILGVPPSSGALTSTQSSAGSMGPPQGEVDQMYPALPPYSSCSDLYPEPVSFHDPQSNPGLTYSPQDYQAAKPALDSNLFPMIPDYNLYHHPNDMGTITEHKPFQSLDPIRVNPPPITPLETIKAFKDKQIRPGSFAASEEEEEEEGRSPPGVNGASWPQCRAWDPLCRLGGGVPPGRTPSVRSRKERFDLSRQQTGLLAALPPRAEPSPTRLGFSSVRE
nr:PREDICTED: early growth response protein 3-like [Opisthocomus hoazin]